jgi:uncharacterized protein (DUF486 family)
VPPLPFPRGGDARRDLPAASLRQVDCRCFTYRPRQDPHAMPVMLQTTLLLICSNVFMTFAWYAHLKDMSGRPWFIAALVSWGVALAEYLLQVPANRIGYTTMNLGQLKILQEVIALSVFVPFAVLYMKQPLKLNYLWAALCICGAVYFVFRDS